MEAPVGRGDLASETSLRICQHGIAKAGSGQRIWVGLLFGLNACEPSCGRPSAQQRCRKMNVLCAEQPQWAPWLNPQRFAGLICLLLLAAYWRVLLGGESFYYRDYGVLGYPYIYYHHAAFW